MLICPQNRLPTHCEMDSNVIFLKSAGNALINMIFRAHWSHKTYTFIVSNKIQLITYEVITG